MSDAPERIWAWNFIAEKQDDVIKGGWDDVADRKSVEYTRADLSPQWLPLDSAPRDGTWVLIWIGWIGNPRSSAFEHGSWQNLPWVANSKDYNPTHWMPLPKPPT